MIKRSSIISAHTRNLYDESLLSSHSAGEYGFGNARDDASTNKLADMFSRSSKLIESNVSVSFFDAEIKRENPATNASPPKSQKNHIPATRVPKHQDAKRTTCGHIMLQPRGTHMTSEVGRMLSRNWESVFRVACRA